MQVALVGQRVRAVLLLGVEQRRLDDGRHGGRRAVVGPGPDRARVVAPAAEQQAVHGGEVPAPARPEASRYERPGRLRRTPPHPAGAEPGLDVEQLDERLCRDRPGPAVDRDGGTGRGGREPDRGAGADAGRGEHGDEVAVRHLAIVPSASDVALRSPDSIRCWSPGLPVSLRRAALSGGEPASRAASVRP
jgi:hypothetical protein